MNLAENKIYDLPVSEKTPTKKKSKQDIKRERIENKKHSVYNLREQIQLKYIAFLKLVNFHFVGILFMSLLLFGACVIHSLSTVSILELFFSDVNTVLLYSVAVAIAIGLEALSIYLFSEYNDRLSHIVSSVSILMILGVSFNEYYTNDKALYSSLLRAFLGSIFLIGSLTVASNIRSLESSKKRIKFEHLPRAKRKELLKTLSEISENNRLNYRDLLNCYKVTSTSLRDLCIKKGIYHSKYFAQMPAKRNRKNKVK